MSDPFDYPIFNTKKMLKVRAIAAFDCTCVYCQKVGDEDVGPDNRGWHLDRIKPKLYGGEYEADNVTLACATCNQVKSAQIVNGIESLRDREFQNEMERFREYEDQKSFSSAIDTAAAMQCRLS